jgi:hypothetical protein
MEIKDVCFKRLSIKRASTRDSSLSLMDFRLEAEVFLFSTASRSALGSIRIPASG